MAGSYNTHSEQTRSEMLGEIGVESIDHLFDDVPGEVRLDRTLDLPQAISEWELESILKSHSRCNQNVDDFSCLIGGGKYNHQVPAVVDAIVSRGEFLTSYTPYQPEMSQGILQALFEYQQLMSKVTGLPVVNSSSYDGATALVDAAWMACSIQGRKRILVSSAIWDEHREVLDTYLEPRGVKISMVGICNRTGGVDRNELEERLGKEEFAGFLFQSPNSLGIVEDVEKINRIIQKSDCLSVLSFTPLLSGLLKTPGEMGVDIVVGEGQPLGIHLNAGGSSLGILSTKDCYRRFVPGRIVGKVTDIKGNLAYSLVFEDREQQVARDKATSNICSNQAMNAIRACIFLGCYGEAGFAGLARLNYAKAHYLRDRLGTLKGLSFPFSGPFFNEFVVGLPKSAGDVLAYLTQQSIFGGLDCSQKFGLDHAILISVTENLSKSELDHFVTQLGEAIR
ncbi:MAG: aminomethyl-transferring glycine dehydrogenase subunit GcvPA [Verrucomicrobiales bacterium]|nr:aminomethyl-transferring glycine dehydrogenase subunit GcvPA [Verrucomicrobiales bacterium]